MCDFVIPTFHMPATLLLLNPDIYPYSTGVVAIVIGLVVIFRKGLSELHGLDRVIAFGGLFVAFPMAVFGADHFTFHNSIVKGVPAWMPFPMFVTYFVGVALVAAALSILVRKCSTLAAAMLALMLFCFSTMVDMAALIRMLNRPNYISTHHDQAQQAAMLMFRELSFSAGALALALTQANTLSNGFRRTMISVTRVIIAIASIAFGVRHFLRPHLETVIPLQLRLPEWYPVQTPIAYITGIFMIACGLAILVNWRARTAAVWLGIYVFIIVMVVYLPVMISQHDVNRGLNAFADTLVFSGVALLLAGALSRTTQGRMATGGAEAFNRVAEPAIQMSQSRLTG